jgi:hypothetical protein
LRQHAWLGTVRGNIRRVKPIAVCLVLLLQSFSTVFLMAKSTYAQSGMPESVVINEFSSDSSADWVELYNTTSAVIDLTGWRIKNSAAGVQTITGSVGAHDFMLVNMRDFLESGAGTIVLADDADAVNSAVNYGDTTIPAPAAGQSTTRTINGGAAWTTGSPTPGTTNIVDVLPPSIPVGGTPSGGTQATYAFDFSWQPATDVGGGQVQYEFRASRTDLEGAVISDPLGSPSLPFQSVAGVSDGQWYWQVRALDVAGNRSDWSEVWQVMVDASGPGVEMLQPTGSVLFGGSATPQIPFSATIRDDRGVSYRLELDGADVTSQTANDSGKIQQAVTATFDATLLEDGNHVFRLIATDGVGHSSELSRGFITDKTSPVLSTNIRNNQIVRGIVAIEAAADDLHLSDSSIAIVDEGDQPVTLRESQDEPGIEESRVKSGLHYDWDTTEVPDGTYHIRISGNDAAGNTATLIRTVTVNNVLVIVGQGIVLGNDPLLEQLSKQLTQPFVATAVFSPTSLPGDITEQVVSTDANPVVTGVPETDRNASIAAVAPSEDGWRVFGVAWYWWLLLGVVGGFALQRFRGVLRQTVASSLS